MNKKDIRNGENAMNLNKIFTVLLFLTAIGFSQDSFDNIHLFQSFMRDATITMKDYDEAFFDFSNYEFRTQYAMALQGGFLAMDKIEINGRFGFGGLSIRDGESQSGLTDLTLSGRYSIHRKSPVKITAGAGITFPFGAENAGYGRFAMGGFGALRYTVNEKILITSSLGLDIIESDLASDESSSLSLSGGVIYLFDENLGFVGELGYKSKLNYSLLSVGADYLLAKNRIRGVIGIGLDEGAPDFKIQVGYIFSFQKSSN